MFNQGGKIMNIPELHNTIGTGNSREGGTAHPRTETEKATSSPRTATRTDAAGERKQPELSKDEAIKLAGEIQSKLQEGNVNVAFKVDENLDTVQIELRDDAGNVVRKIPSDDFLKLSKNIREGRPTGFLNRSY
jgi:uncharacterized FlaG/YvyC family protein